MINWPQSDYWVGKYPQIIGQKCLAISQIASLGRPCDNAVIFATILSEKSLAVLGRHRGCLLLLSETNREISMCLAEKHGLIYSEDPRYQFAEVLEPLWTPQSLRGRLTWDLDRGISMGENVQIDPTAVVEPGVTICRDCIIGGHVHIMAGARLGPKVRIGAGTVIRENAVIGGWGFGFARALGKPTIRLPHIGGTIIGNNVEIGALTTICSGTIDPTIIEDSVIIDDHVHIAHNCRVCDNAIVTACAEVSGGVSVGRSAWLAPNCAIIDRINIGARSVVGIGATVVKSIEDNAIVVGKAAQIISNACCLHKP